MHHHRRRVLLRTLFGVAIVSAALIAPATSIAASPAAMPATTVAASCTAGHWPARTQGRPVTLQAHGAAGDYLWHNAKGWHLRVTHRGSAGVVFTGKIVSDQPLTVVPRRLESRDTYTLSGDGLTLTYRFVNHGGVDGLDIRTACATQLRVRGAMAGAKLPVRRIWLGRAGLHPHHDPFVIKRAA